MRLNEIPCRVALLALLVFIVGIGRAEAQFNPLSGIVGAIEAAAEDRSSGDIATDLKLKTAIVAALTDKLGKEGALIGVDVYEQDVMLTGSVSTAPLKAQANAVARAATGVKKTYNELLLDADLAKESQKGAAQGFVDDTVIEKKINALFLEDKAINVTNFRWRSVKGHVFLFGRALSSAENARATEVARSIANVVSVVNRAKVKPKPKK
jgi:hyperosmotically inducible protein